MQSAATTAALIVSRISGSHRSLEHWYGCPATMTVATFVAHGMLHRARRFWRLDMHGTGRIEIYLLEPYPGIGYSMMSEDGWYAGTGCEGALLRYANENARTTLDILAVQAIAAAQRSMYTGPTLDEDMTARFKAIEIG